MAVLFTNPGLIELRGLKTFGVNAKVSTNPHGMWGTGAKYSIAIAMRTGHKMTLWRGLDRYTFTTKPVEMRGKDFKFIEMVGPNGEREELPFTTELGKGWPTWGMMRELACNALDEGGTYRSYGSNLWGRNVSYSPRPDETAFLVEGDEIDKVYQQKDTIFLSTKALFDNEWLSVHPGPSKYIYYRGVRVYEMPNESLYTYNLKVATLTEDRTLASRYDFDVALGATLGNATDLDYLEKTMTAQPPYMEADASYLYCGVSDAFAEVYTRLRAGGTVGLLSSFANNAYLKTRGKAPLPAPIKLNSLQQRQLEKAISFCERLGWDVRAYPIEVIPSTKDHVLALAVDGKIVLTERVFDMGVKELVNAIYEEFVHLRFGLSDMTRELQTHLIRQIVNMGEQQLSEPL